MSITFTEVEAARLVRAVTGKHQDTNGAARHLAAVLGYGTVADPTSTSIYREFLGGSQELSFADLVDEGVAGNDEEAFTIAEDLLADEETVLQGDGRRPTRTSHLTLTDRELLQVQVSRARAEIAGLDGDHVALYVHLDQISPVQLVTFTDEGVEIAVEDGSVALIRPDDTRWTWLSESKVTIGGRAYSHHEIRTIIDAWMPEAVLELKTDEDRRVARKGLISFLFADIPSLQTPGVPKPGMQVDLDGVRIGFAAFTNALEDWLKDACPSLSITQISETAEDATWLLAQSEVLGLYADLFALNGLSNQT